MRKILIFLLMLLSLGSSALASAKPSHKQSLLDGSPRALAAENYTADTLKLPRIKNDQELAHLIKQGRLILLGTHKCFESHDTLPPAFRFVRSHTRRFLVELSTQFCKKFPGAKLRVTSAVRTAVYQQKLMQHNLNAARGTRSSHLTGATIDITKKELTAEQISWLQKTLKRYERAGRIHATEEKYSQVVFHIMVIH